MAIAPPKTSGYTLTQVAVWGRGFIKYGLMTLVVLMISRILWNGALNVYRALNPPKPPGPTFGFGTLPELVFPAGGPSVAQYTLETRTGGLPSAPKLLPVYLMPQQSINLLSLDAAKKQAAGLGFVFPEEEVTPTRYRWKRTTPLPTALEIDIIHRSFTLRTDWSSDPNFLADTQLPSETSVVSQAKGVLENAGLLGADMATSSGKITYLRAQGSDYAIAPSYSEAEFLQVDLNRTPIDNNYPILRPDPNFGNARLIFSGSKLAQGSVIEAEYSYFPVDYQSKETYPLLTPTEAWQRLSAGQGFVASLDMGTQNVVVRDMYLAYYDSDDPQEYLQPIYVFTGDKNFIGYVAAVNRNPSSGKE